MFSLRSDGFLPRGRKVFLTQWVRGMTERGRKIPSCCKHLSILEVPCLPQGPHCPHLTYCESHQLCTYLLERSQFSGLKFTVITELKIFRGDRHSRTLPMGEQSCPASDGRDLDHNEQNHMRAMGWMFASPQNSHAEILTPKVMVLGAGALGDDEVKRVGPSWMGSVPS